MDGIIAWFARNSVAANMLMFIILAGGLLAIPETKKEIFPNISLDTISIVAVYPGASPSEVEEAVCTRIERAVDSLPGIESLNATASENLCSVTIQVAYGTATRDLMEKVKGNVDAIAGFPSIVPRPIVKEVIISNPIARLVVSGEANHRALKVIAENVRNDLSDLGLSRVKIGSARAYEISIEISEADLQRYNMTFMEVAQAINRNSMKTSGGSVATSGGTVAVEAVGQAETADDFRNIVLRAQADGGHVKLGDVATIYDGFEEFNWQTFFDGKPAVTLSVFQEGNTSLLELSETLNKYLENPKRHFPEGISLTLDSDNAKYFKSRIDLLMENAISGLALVFVTLMLFLHTRLSFWVSVGIPISFLGGFIVLYLSGGSINMISTFALLIVLGIVVDDAIILGENIYRHQTEENNRGTEGAVIGAQEISKPVIFAVLTTAVSFSPMFFLPGPDGKLIAAIPTIVVATLFFSLIECLLILPAHLAHQPKIVTKPGPLARVQQKFSVTIDRFINRVYRPLLDLTLSWRYTALTAFVTVFFISFALIAGGWININLISSIEADVGVANINFPDGTRIEKTREVLLRAEKAALEVKEELFNQYQTEQIEHVRTTITNHNGTIILTMAGADQRKLPGKDIIDMWRKKVGPIPEASELSFTSTFNKPGPPVNIELSAYDSTKLKAAAAALREHISDYPATYNVRDSFQGGKREVQLHLKPNAYDLGLDLQGLAGQVHQAFQGIEVQSLRRNQDEVKVFLRYPQEERSSLWHLENMRVRLSDGSHVPLVAVADVFYGVGPTKIIRHDSKRIITVEAYVDEGIASSATIMRSIKSNFLDKLEYEYPGVRWIPAGSQKVRDELQDSLILGFLVAMLVMYMLMATLFRSYAQPILVMTAIPFGIIGALAGHLLMGEELTLWSAAGMIAVSGVVVNDNMVLIFYINGKREQGESLFNAIKEAGAARFRPIMITSITTFAGLTPLMAEKSWEAQFLIPMAISISFGVMFATLVSLLLIPALYLMLEDINRLFHRVKLRMYARGDDGEIRYSDDIGEL